jgi:calcineurin-like phosphoesterase family protein
MNKALVEKHNSRVSPEDNVFFLGDFAFCSIEKQKHILSLLNGNKYLYLGNHDRSEKVMREIGFLDVFKTGDMFFEGIKFRISHYPFAPYDHIEANIRYPDRRPSRDCDWLLCGHIHEKWKILENQINVGVDVWDFFPVSLNEILEIVACQK